MVMAPCLVTVTNFFLLHKMALSSKTEPRIKFKIISFPGKYTHEKWRVGKEDNMKIEPEFMYYLYVKDDQCKIVKNKTLVIK